MPNNIFENVVDVLAKLIQIQFLAPLGLTNDPIVLRRRTHDFAANLLCKHAISSKWLNCEADEDMYKIVQMQRGSFQLYSNGGF